MAMTNEEYEHAVCEEGQRRRLTFDMEVRAMIKEAVEIEREACAMIVEQPWQGHFREVAAQIRARSNNGL